MDDEHSQVGFQNRIQFSALRIMEYWLGKDRPELNACILPSRWSEVAYYQARSSLRCATCRILAENPEGVISGFVQLSCPHRYE